VAEASRESPSGSLLAGMLIGPLSVLVLLLAGLSSLPLVSGGRAHLLLFGLPGILCGWAAPGGRRLLAAAPTAMLLGLVGLRTGYYLIFFIPLFVLGVLVGTVAGAFLAVMVPARPRTLVAAVVLVGVAFAGYLATRDRVVFIVTHSSAQERSSESLLGIPGPDGRANALVAIGERYAEAGKRDEAKEIFREARRNATQLEFGPSGVAEDIVRAEIAAGMYRSAEDDLVAISPQEDARLRFLANEYLNVGETERARPFVEEMAPKDRFYFLQKLAETQALAHRRDLAHASIQELWALARDSSDYERPTQYAAVGNTLIRLGFVDEGVDALARYAPEELPRAAKRAEDDEQPELALQLWGLAADAGITVDRYGTPHSPLPHR
jgi:hypothetical protein